MKVRDKLVEILERFQDAWGDINSTTNRELLALQIEAEMVTERFDCTDCDFWPYPEYAKAKTIKGFIVEGQDRGDS
jgi:hypothetical protein